MPMTKHRVILNPAAAKGTAADAIPGIERLFSEYGLDYELVHTERPWHAAELARDAALSGYDVVVAAGGDGTSNEVLNGLMQARQAGSDDCAMGVLCIGRGNDFAFGMGVPLTLEEGCRALSRRHTRRIDVGHVRGGLFPEGRFVGNGIGIGFDAVVGFEAAKFKRLGGYLGYVLAALKTVFLYYRAPLVEIEFDGERLTQPSLMVSLMNGRRMGGGFLMAPDAKPDDGLFDLCVAHQVSRATALFRLIPLFTKGLQATHAAIKTGRASRMVVSAIDGALPAHADGETLCVDGHRLELEVLPRQIALICAAPAETG